MGTVYVQDRKHGGIIDGSMCFLRDGNGDSAPMTDVAGFHEGDEFSLMLDIPSEIAKAINNQMFEGVRAYQMGIGDGKYTIHIRFVVARISHSASWHKVGNLINLGTAIYLEAQSGIWEDIYRICWLNERPKWICDEEEGE